MVWGLGNISKDPRFVDADGLDNIFGTEDDDLRLQAGSPCIDAGDNEVDTDAIAPGVQLLPGVDADLRVRRFDDPATTDKGSGTSPIVDMGAYESGSPPIPSILYVNDDADGANTGTSWEDAFTDLQMALQTAFLACGKVKEIWVATGTYRPAPPWDDRDESFRLLNGVAIYGGFAGTEDTLDQRNPIANLTVLSGDLNNDDGPGFANRDENSYHVVTASYTDSTAILDGFTISGGNGNLPDSVNDRGAGLYVSFGSPTITNCTFSSNFAELGGGLYCELSSPALADCTIISNTATERGGGCYCLLSTPALADCTISDNAPDGMHIEKSSAWIVGIVQIASDNWVGREAILDGEGTLQIQAGVTLDLDDSTIRCNVSGPGTILVGVDSELTVEADAVIDLGYEAGPNGQIICDGLLRLRQNSTLMSGEVYVSRASFEDNAIIANCVIDAQAGAPYGQFFVEDNVHLWLDKIRADGDRYLDLDPSEFDCNNVHVDAIEVNITEGIGGTYGGLFEARGREMEIPSCGPDDFFCQVDSVPDFDPNTWTIDRLELEAGAKINLTNRFDFQSPYDSGGSEEVLYVRNLILREGAILNTSFNRIYYENLVREPNSVVKNVPLLGFSLNNIAFDDDIEFITRITHNNLVDRGHPEYDRIHIERVVGADPDLSGMMRMCNLPDLDPSSPKYQQVVNARAKGLFARSKEDEILIRFEYLFGTSEPGLELVIYLTDVPELLEHYDPDRQDHYMEVARLPVPPAGRPGSPGSGRFGVFHEYVRRGELDFVRGTRIELEIVGPAGACVYINNWDPQVHCSDLYCGDITGDHGATVLDYLTVVASVGSPAGLLPDGSSTACLEFGFGVDGRVDTLDVSAWAWMLGLEEPLNLCDVPLTPSMATVSATTGSLEGSDITRLFSSEPPGIHLDALLVTGKRGTSDDLAKLEDNLYVLDSQGQYIDKFEPESNHANGRLVQDYASELYQVNCETGVVRLDGPDEVIVPPGQVTYANEPRYNKSAAVYIGIQNEDSDPFGRPILDAAFDADYVYVVPAVVSPYGEEAYAAAAKLRLLDAGDPPYEVVQLYDDPPPAADNQHRNNLREIEIDGSGNLYVISTHNLNEGDILWVYDTDTGVVKRSVELANKDSDCYLPAPAAMHVSNTKDRLYMASSQNDPDANSDSLYALSKQDLNIVRTIEINGMGHISDITEDPITGTLWVVGFTMSEIPDCIEVNVEPFYEPYLARIPYDSNDVEAMCLSDPVLYPDNDLALPLSIMWTAKEERVSFVDFAEFATHWLESDCAFPDWCGGADFTGDGSVTMDDLRTFSENWLGQSPYY
jgi:hypothetical protein